ncbi:hypothetical protein [Pseudonocardia sp.]|uniref:hypothetical protein n=1 Tax=Pseudonocardia sp. TaxID=60912 RepID=UPI00260C7809|nr:hypothetical protein [Pseudonocardia sp.]
MSADPGSGATRVGARGGATHDGSYARADTDPTAAAVTPSTTSGDIRHDRIRWGAVWTGVVTTVSLYIVLQLLFFSLGWLDLGYTGAESGTARGVVSGVLGLVAFLLGGMATGASALWRRANDGMINAVVTWAAAVVTLLVLALVGGGALLGSLADVVAQSVNLQSAPPNVDVGGAVQAARQSAGWAALALGLSVAASGLGGSLGAKLWPGRGDRNADRR